MPVQDRIHLAQEHFVSGEKKQSGSPQKAAVRNFKLLTSAKKLKDCNHLPRIVIRIQNECGGTDALYQLSRKETLEQRHVSK